MIVFIKLFDKKVAIAKKNNLLIPIYILQVIKYHAYFMF
jgi:hypothetical protein